MNNKSFVSFIDKIKVESSNNQLTINVEQQELKEQPNKNAVSLSGSQLELMLEKNEAKAQELTLTWIDKWKKMEQNEVDNNPTETTTNLTGIVPLSSSSSAVAGVETPDVVRTKKFSSGFMVESDLPYIVALNNDALDSDIRVYYIRPGETVLGCDETDSHIGSSRSKLILIIQSL